MHTEECKRLEKEYGKAVESYNRIRPLPVPEPNQQPRGIDNLKDIISVKKLMEEKKEEWEQYCKANCK